MPNVLVNNKIYTVEKNQTLYDGLEINGFVLPHGCLAGACGACKIEIKSGAENLSTPSAVELDTLLHINDQKKNLRLACRAKVLGDITVSNY